MSRPAARAGRQRRSRAFAVAPGAVTVGPLEVVHDVGGASCNCGEAPYIRVPVEATDDRAPTSRLGYLIEVTGGPPPRDFYVSAAPMASQGTGVRLYFNGDHGFAFTIAVRAVDLNGNVGPPTEVTIVDAAPDDGGCATGHASRLATPGWVLVATLVALRRRRRRACRHGVETSSPARSAARPRPRASISQAVAGATRSAAS